MKCLCYLTRRRLRISLAFTCLLLLCGCGDTGAEPEAPKQVRLCGDLVGVEPVEPTVIGEDEYGCPVFQPVPCTRPRHEQEWACGPDCRTATAFDSEGDEWVMGCAGGVVPCPLDASTWSPTLHLDRFAWWTPSRAASGGSKPIAPLPTSSSFPSPVGLRATPTPRKHWPRPARRVFARFQSLNAPPRAPPNL